MVINTQDNRQRIIAAARDAFTTEGYRSSIEHIARLAGVAKQTVYNHFPTKEVLFDEMIRDNMNVFSVPLSGSPETPDKTLTDFAIIYCQNIMTGQCSAWLRMIASEAPRFSEMAARSYALGPGAMMDQLADYIDRAMKLGKLRQDNPLFAAEMLYGMLSGAERTRMLFGITREPYDEKQRAINIVECFMRAYRP